MTPAPLLEPFAQDLYRSLRPIPQVDHALEHIAQAVGRIFQPIDDLVRDTEAGVGWSVLLDPDRIPASGLPWLAQFNGTRLTPAMTEAERRAAIRANGFGRGTIGALREAVASTLTEPRFVRIFERDEGSAYHLTVAVYGTQTPDPAAAERAARSQKAVGLRMAFRVDAGWTIGEMEAAYAAQTIADFEGDFVNLADLEGNVTA